MSLLTDLQLQVDEVAGPIFFPVDQLLDALNSAQLDLSNWTLSSSTLAISSGADIVSLPTDLMIPKYITYNNIKIFPTTQALLQDWSNYWRTDAPSRPNWMVLFDWQHIRLYPRSNNTYNFNVYGIPWPVEVTQASPDISADVMQKRAVVAVAASKLFEETQPQLADAKYAEGKEWEARYCRQQRNLFGDNIGRMRPGNAWDISQFGNIPNGRRMMGSQ